jgi:hypothetical protein
VAEHESAAGTPEDVDPALVGAAADAIHAFYAAHPENESEDDAIRVLLAAALPLYEQQLREQLAAANERAETAEKRASTLTAVRDLAASAVKRYHWQRDEAQARLAELGEAETQQRIVGVNGTSHPTTERDLENRDLWVPGVRLEERQVYATPWRDAKAADATAAAHSATQTDELEFDAPAHGTKLEGAQRGAQGPQEAAG